MFSEIFSEFGNMLILIPLSTLALSIVLSLGVYKLFPTWNILDFPEKYGHNRNPIPYPGGVAIVLSFLLSLVLFFPIDLQLWGVIWGIILLAIVSFWDDRKGVHPVFRLGLQILLGILLVSTGTEIIYISNPFGEMAFELSPLIAAVATVLWCVGLMNTVNWLDGVPGAASGTSVLAGIFLGALSLSPVVDQPVLATMCFAFAAANFGFTFFNIAPPKILNGDTGAMFSGFLIAVLSIFSGGKIATAFLVLAIPVFDAFCVIFHRLKSGQSPFKGGDRRHLHDQLKKRGFSERQTLLLFLLISTLLGLSGLYLQTLGKLLFLSFVGLFVFVLSWQAKE